MELGINRKLGYFTTHDASSNDNALQYIAEKSADIAATFDPVFRRIHPTASRVCLFARLSLMVHAGLTIFTCLIEHLNYRIPWKTTS